MKSRAAPKGERDMTVKVCRTCGFADCEGATTGNCPRWPSRDTADLDVFVTEQLSGMHLRACQRAQQHYESAVAITVAAGRIPWDDEAGHARLMDIWRAHMAAGWEQEELALSLSAELSARRACAKCGHQVCDPGVLGPMEGGRHV